MTTTEDQRQRTLLHNATIAYYAMDDALMSDAEYDSLFQSIYGESTDPFSLYQSLFTGSGRKRALERAMLSLKKARTAEEVQRWLNKVHEFDADAIVHLAPKYDGLACLVRVEDNRIISATTRGDGTHGEDVTYAVSRIPVEPGFFPEDGLYSVEVCMSVENMHALNQREDVEPYTHPRNAAAGVLRTSHASVRELATYLSMHRHFTTNEYDFSQTIAREDEMHTIMDGYRDELLRRMDEHGVSIMTDGIVMYAHDADGTPLTQMGDDGARPRWAMAWKFPDSAKIATLADVHWQIGRTKNTPVATFNPPVDFDGVLVTRASLHNQDIIDQLGVKIGDQVEIVRSNEVIPYVKALHQIGEERKEIPAEPEVDTISTEIQLRHMLTVLDVRGAGPAVTSSLARYIDETYVLDEQWLPSALVNVLADMLDDGSEYFEEAIDSFAAKSAATFAEELESKMVNADFSLWFATMGLPGLGRRMMTQLFAHLGGARQIISALRSEDELTVPGFGAERIRILRENVDNIEDFIETVDHCVFSAHGGQLSDEATLLDVEPAEMPEEEKDEPAGIAVVTGKIDGWTRTQIEEELAQHGWSLAGSVNAQTDVLFNASGRESSKTKSAAKHNVEVVAVSSMDEIIDTLTQR